MHIFADIGITENCKASIGSYQGRSNCEEVET